MGPDVTRVLSRRSHPKQASQQLLGRRSDARSTQSATPFLPSTMTRIRGGGPLRERRSGACGRCGSRWARIRSADGAGSARSGPSALALDRVLDGTRRTLTGFENREGITTLRARPPPAGYRGHRSLPAPPHPVRNPDLADHILTAVSGIALSTLELPTWPRCAAPTSTRRPPAYASTSPPPTHPPARLTLHD